MGHRKDDLIGIRKARFASFVLLLVCFAAMLIIRELAAGQAQAFTAAAIVIGALIFAWWFAYRQILYDEAIFFEEFAEDMRSVYRRLRILESTVRQIEDGVVIVAEEGGLVLMNETVKRLFTAVDTDIDGPAYDEYAANFSDKLERAAILTAAREGSAPVTICVEGQYYRIGCIPLAAEKDRGRGAVAVISDVTESEKAEKMQVDFISNVFHELMTPLASVKSYAETLKDGSVDDEGLRGEFLGIIVSEADRMEKLAKSLLFLARQEYGGGGTKMVPGDLLSLVRMSIRKLDMAAKEKSITVNKLFDELIDEQDGQDGRDEFPDGQDGQDGHGELNNEQGGLQDEMPDGQRDGKRRVIVEMDRDSIESVVQNVLGNAIKYTGEKGRIDVDIISGQNCVQIVITDNGAGIPEEDLARVFERFFRTDKARSGKTGGTGLGLAISKEIVDAHGGTISIESKLGRGTTVTVSLPIAKTRGTPGIL